MCVYNWTFYLFKLLTTRACHYFQLQTYGFIEKPVLSSAIFSSIFIDGFIIRTFRVDGAARTRIGGVSFLRSYRPYFDSEPLSIIFSFDYDPRHRSPESRDGLETSIVSTRAREEEEKEREKGKNDEGEIKRKKEIWEK